MSYISQNCSPVCYNGQLQEICIFVCFLAVCVDILNTMAKNIVVPVVVIVYATL